MSVKKQLLIVFATLFLTAGALHAQSVTVKASIPFDFVVGDSALHAGTYTIRPINGGSTMMLRSADVNEKAILMAPCTCAYSARHEDELVFKVIGGRYFLWQIWTAGYDTGRELSIDSRDTEVADAGPVQTVVIKAVSAKA
jgi:hypothetical protein